MINDIIQFLKRDNYKSPTEPKHGVSESSLNSLISYYEYIYQSSSSTSKHTLPAIKYTEHRMEEGGR